MVNILCYKSKTLANGEHPLVIRICKDGKKKYQSIGISVKPEYWDFEKNKPKRNCPDKEHILNIIEQELIKYRKQVLEFQSIEKTFSATKLVESVNKPSKKITVEDFFNIVIKQMQDENRTGNAKSFRFALNSMKTFNGTMQILFSDIDVSWLKKYESWMRTNGNSENTMGVRFRAFRAIYNRAIQENIIKRDYYPFDEFKVSKLKNVTQKRAISKIDIQRIIDFDVCNVKNYQSNLLGLSKDIFLFSYFGCGINFIDIAYLTTNNISDNRIIYERHKTGKKINFLLQPYAFDIIKKNNNPNDKYLFPILNEKIHKTEMQQYNRIRKVITKVNTCLHKIAEALNMDINLTTYVARHSYATILKNSGVNIGLISETLGHSDLKTTQIYLDSFENSQIDEAMKNLL